METGNGNAGRWAELLFNTYAIAAGKNSNGQLGSGTWTDALVPSPVMAPPGVASWASVSAGVYHTCAIATNGSLYSFGASGGTGAADALGIGATSGTNVPTLVSALSGVTWASVSAGHLQTCAIASNASLFCWGRAALGLGATTSSSVPRAVSAPGVTSWASVSAGNYHTCGLAVNGTLLCCKSHNQRSSSYTPSPPHGTDPYRLPLPLPAGGEYGHAMRSGMFSRARRGSLVPSM